MRALYRRYRPMKLSEVVGQPQVTEPLMKSLEAGKVGHAYLFVGPRGCGKTSVARILAHEVNGFKYELEDDYVDIIEIDGASNRGIDNIRELREKVMIAPTSGKYKVYIIDEVHMLTKEAFNALLKTLEEPPEHVIFIMATTDAYKVPVTITSRAQVYTFKLADTQVMFDFLKSVCEKEKIQIADEALTIVAKRGGGSFRDSLSLLDQISTLSDDEITKELVVSAMGLPEDEKIGELLAAYAGGDVVKITTVLKDLLASGVKAETLTEELISAILAEPKVELMSLLAKLPEVKAPYAEARLLVALMPSASELHFSGPASRPSTSYTGPRAEPSLRGEPVRDGRNMRLESPNRKMSRENEVPDASPQLPPEGVSLVTHAVEPSSLSGTRFDWGEFVGKVQGLSEAVYSQLVKTNHEVMGGELHIYPTKKIVQTILARDNNKKILVEAAGGVKITIHEYGDTPSGAAKDETLAKISAIMGGEVQNDGGGNPF